MNTAILDQYLLYRNISGSVINEFLQQAMQTKWASSVSAAGLSNGLPEIENEAVASLLRLRISLVHPWEPNAPVIERLRMACEVCNVIHAFIMNGKRPYELEDQLSDCYRHMSRQDQQCGEDHYANEIDMILINLRYCIAMFGARPRDGGTTYTDVMSVCVRTINRIVAYWHSVLCCQP